MKILLISVLGTCGLEIFLETVLNGTGNFLWKEVYLIPHETLARVRN